MSRLVLALFLLLAQEEPEKSFPFVLPWDDASPGITNLSELLPKPAGKDGPIVARDGHFYSGERRTRFIGVNLCFGANFPKPEDGAKIAARMAKFGINVVRFHHMEMFEYPGGIRAKAAGSGELHPEALARLDAFIAELKKNGIYANLNLLVSRPLRAGDGLPASIEQVGWKERHGLGFFNPACQETQKDYARALLLHKNAVTGLTYAEDPAVGFVEINNEHGLINDWMMGDVERWPAEFRQELQVRWNAWLKTKHASTDALRKAWGARNDPLGEELLAGKWSLEQHQGAQATLTPSEGALAIAVAKTGAEGWHLQVNQGGLKLEAERPYTLSFRAKAAKPSSVSVSIGMAHAPWQGLGFASTARLTAEEKDFTYVVLLNKADDNARLGFSGFTEGCTLSKVSLKPGGSVGLAAGESLEQGGIASVAWDRRGERTKGGRADWLRFLWETEDAYWREMQRFLKDEIKVRGVVFGTIIACSTPNLMAAFAATDVHAYWQHPHFPRRPWDDDDWIVENKTMVNDPGGVLPGLALRRVLTLPHSVTEYNAPAPMTYGGETFPLLCAYAGLQDWDALYAFAYSHRGGDWDPKRITGFFDIDSHPTKMATLVAAAAQFHRGDVKPAKQLIAAPLHRDVELEALDRTGAWNLVSAQHVGVAPEAALVHRIALATDGIFGVGGPFEKPEGPVYASDTGELRWDLSDNRRGVVTVNSPDSRAVIGYGGGKRFDLGGVIVEPGATLQDGWGVVTLTRMKTGWLVTASGNAENTDQKWKSPAKNSVGRNWGKAPSRVEGIPVKLTLPSKSAKAWALDEKGQRGAELSVADGVLTLGPQHKTIWYEVETK